MTDWLSEEESQDLLTRLFPKGLGGDDVMAALCSEGWADSSLRLALHPTPERAYEELVRMRENIERLHAAGEERRKRLAEEQGAGGEARKLLPEPRPLEPLPDFETFRADYRARSEEQTEPDSAELGRLLGLCLWDVLSDNHDLILPDGRVRHLGSFRATAGIIADFYHQKPPPAPDEDFAFDFSALDMSYCEFYMGTAMISGRTDLGPIYRFIFERLQASDHAWQYAFPKLGVVSFADAGGEGSDWEGYDPSNALAEAEEKRKKAQEFREMQESLERLHEESLEAAKSQPEPATVVAYRAVFGHWPAGWPPWE